eukprot:919984-Pelagomonas_calceolata.AAC.5
MLGTYTPNAFRCTLMRKEHAVQMHSGVQSQEQARCPFALHKCRELFSCPQALFIPSSKQSYKQWHCKQHSNRMAWWTGQPEEVCEKIGAEDKSPILGALVAQQEAAWTHHAFIDQCFLHQSCPSMTIS